MFHVHTVLMIILKDINDYLDIHNINDFLYRVQTRVLHFVTKCGIGRTNTDILIPETLFNSAIGLYSLVLWFSLCQMIIHFLIFV